MAKTLAQMEDGLRETYSGPTFEKNGFTYIPWNEAVKVANRVFGIDGYNIEVVRVMELGEGYMAHVRVTVYPSDSKSFIREGIGYNELQGQGGRAHDTAVKGAASDGANRAFKLFGEAFGLALYDKAESAPSGQRPPTASYAGGSSGGDKRPSEKQLPFLLKAGFTQKQIDAMPFAEWKAALDAYFAQPKPSAAKAPAKAAAGALDSVFGELN